MELTKKKERNSKSLFQAEEVDTINMEINKEAYAMIMDRLTDMYVDKIGSIVRELVSNALDATVDNKGKVTITTPSGATPKLIVKDEGTGMNEEDIRNIYTKYGASTKTTDFTKIGAYGLGAKVPLAYTDNFLVETTKDGITINGKVSRDSDRTIFEIVSKKKTNLPNGTAVTVPVKYEDTMIFGEKVSFYEKHQESLTTNVEVVRSENFFAGRK